MTKYKILTGSDVIYDSSNKYEYPVTEPVLNLELGEAGNLEFTILPGHPQHGKLLEMQSFVSAYQDDEQLFYGRVLQADEDIYHQIKITCEGALTFLLDSEMEPETYTETISAFFTRCINEHNRQVEAAKQFSVGVVQHEEASKILEFKLEGYNQTRQVLDNLLTGKHGGFLNVRYENGQRYLDYIQQFSKVNNQPIKTGLNVIDRDKHVSGENLFTIVRPLGKNGLTIEGASSVNLLDNASYVYGKYLKLGGGDEELADQDMVHSSLITVTPGSTYWYGPGEVYASFYDEDETCMATMDPDGTYSFTVPVSIEGFDKPVKYVRLSYHKIYDKKITLIGSTGSASIVAGFGGINGKKLGYADGTDNDPIRPGETSDSDVLIFQEKEYDAPDWSYLNSMIQVTPGQTYIAIPGSANVGFYGIVESEEEESESTSEETDSEESPLKCVGVYVPQDDLGCDIFTVPENAIGMKVSYTNRFGSAMKIIPYNGTNLASRNSGANNKIVFHAGAVEEIDAEWCYTSNYIDVEEDTYYTGGPSRIKVAFYDANKKFLSLEEAHREGFTMHYVKSPSGAKYARVCFLSSYVGEQQLQKGKALILTKLDKGTKTILMPERIAKYGQIIHTEQFADIDDAQVLYNAAVEWIALHQAMLPASVDIGIVDLHLLNPEIDAFELGDVYDNLEGFEGEAVTIGSITKDMENPANDKVTVKNLAELSGSDAGKSSGSLSSKYASSCSGGGSGQGSKYPHIIDEEDGSLFSVTNVKEILLKALEQIGIEAPRIKLLAEERDGIKAQIDLIARGKEGNESRISLTDTAAIINSANIKLEAENIYNIADNVVTIARNVYTHANLIWTEAKDIVTIADNVFTVADNVVTIADRVFTHANLIYNQAIDIVNEAENIYNIADNVVTIARNVYTHANLIWTEAKDIVTIADNVFTVADNVVTIADRVFTHANLIYNQAIDIVNEAENIYNIADNVVTIARNVYTHANLIWTEAKDIVTIADRIWTISDDIVTLADRIYTQANLIVSVSGDVDMLSGDIKGSVIWQERNNITQAVGQMHFAYDEDEEGRYKLVDGAYVLAESGYTGTRYSPRLHIIDGTALVQDKTVNGQTIGMGYYNNDNLTAGVLVEKLISDTTIVDGEGSTARTALKLLGDEIDIRGNTTIKGFLEVKGTIYAPEFVLKNTVKIGGSGSTSVNLSDAIGSISVSNGQLTYTTLGGATSAPINFNSASSIIGISIDGASFGPIYFVSSNKNVVTTCNINLLQNSQSSPVAKILTNQSIYINATKAYNAGWNDALDHCSGAFYYSGSPKSVVYDDDHLTHTVIEDPAQVYRYTIPNRIQE